MLAGVFRLEPLRSRTRQAGSPRAKVSSMSTAPLLGLSRHLCCIVLAASLGASALCAVALANPQSDGDRKTPAQLTTPAPAMRICGVTASENGPAVAMENVQDGFNGSPPCVSTLLWRVQKTIGMLTV